MQVYEATFIMMIDRQRDAVKLKKTVLNTVWPRAIIGLLVWQEVSRVKRSRFAISGSVNSFQSRRKPFQTPNTGIFIFAKCYLKPSTFK